MKDSFIKHLKPRKNSRYHQGYVNPQTLTKYANECKDQPIIYRSGLEWKFMQYCECVDNITKWASEPLAIPYYNRLLKKQANYYIDYIIENKNGDKCLVEVKPYSQTQKPDAFATEYAKKAWVTNVDKWNAAKAYADAHNMKFIIVTEQTLDKDTL